MTPKLLSLSLCLTLALAGCASTEEIMRTNADPLEGYNRFMYSVNDTVDKAVLKPVAQGYEAITPELIDTGVTNFFNNLGEIVTITNDLLQFKFHQGLEDTSRFLYNSTFGVLGLVDVATHMGLPRNQEDFGQTLGYWGVGEGYFLILPLLGPSTTRDVWGIPADRMVSPTSYVQSDSVSYGLIALNLIDTRAGFLQAERAFAEGALDPYVLQRDAYLQRRRNLVFDGNPPQPEFNFDDLEDFDDDFPAE